MNYTERQETCPSFPSMFQRGQGLMKLTPLTGKVNAKRADSGVAAAAGGGAGGDDGDDFEMLSGDVVAEDGGIPAKLLEDDGPTTGATASRTANQKKKDKLKQVSTLHVHGCTHDIGLNFNRE